MLRAVGALASLVLLSGCAGLATGYRPEATAELRDATGRVVGTARLEQVGDVVHIVVEMKGLPPGVHAVHIHAVGRCEPPDFASAGGHFNPGGRQHGLLNPQGPHAGDLPNITIDADGTGRLETVTEGVTLGSGPTTLFDADGRALVVHASADDFKTDPAGNAGARIACGAIVKAEPPTPAPSPSRY